MTGSTGPDADLAPGESFAALGIAPARVEVLAARGIHVPFTVQRAVVPDALAGRDVLARARTGRGKTLAYLLPLVELLAVDAPPLASGGRTAPRALVLAPTRELAQQIATELAPLAATAALRVLVVHGGTAPADQVDALAAGIDVLVACPGRLDELVSRADCRLDALEMVVLDEADQLADPGFAPVVTALLAHAPAASRLLLSATLGPEVRVLLGTRPTAPAIHEVDLDAVEDAVDEHVWLVPHWHRGALVQRLAGGPTPVILFARTRHGVRRLAAALATGGIEHVVLHGDLAPPERVANLAAFTSDAVRVLVATDLAARGLDFAAVPLVVHVEPPSDPTAYVHRSGRTARAGRRGVVVTLCMPDQEHRLAKLRAAGALEAPTVAVTPDDPLVDRVLASASARGSGC